MTEKVDAVRTNFLETLETIREGELVFEAAEGLEQLIQAIRETRSKGTLTITLEVKPTSVHDAGKVFVTGKAKGKLPEKDVSPTLFYTADDNTLRRNNPNQMRLPFDTETAGGGDRE